VDSMDKSVVRIAVDAMGGDYAPAEVVKGAVQAAQRGGVEIILVGPEDRVQAELSRYDVEGLSLLVHHTSQFIVDGESPARALRAKPEASMLVTARLVKEGQAEAAVTLGHTGAAMISALWVLGTLEGLQRPVAGGVACFLAPQTMLLDLGVNVDCKPRQLLQFAAIGVAYARSLLGIPEPTVALLSNGSEEGKGTERVKEAHQLLKRSGFKFIGNVEGWDIPAGRANVIVCDGFVGNVFLKYGEGLSRALAAWLQERLAGLLPAQELARLGQELGGLLELEEQVGGGPLLGVKGVMVVGHGRSRAPAIEKAIGQARLAVVNRLVETIEEEWRRISRS
jgi:glycerol-3-phosphate acyltransferase PlsX